jgi:hypothetical protein
VGRCVRYRQQDLIAFINRQVRQSTSEVSA